MSDVSVVIAAAIAAFGLLFIVGLMFYLAWMDRINSNRRVHDGS